MSDSDPSNHHRTPDSCCSGAAMIFHSFSIFLRNPTTFLTIYALTVLPLSFLLLSLSLSSRPIQAEILNLELVALAAPTRFEARHVWQESRAAALSLMRRRALFLLPCSVLSLLALVSAVSSAATAASGRRPRTLSAASAVRNCWKCAAATSIFAYGVVFVYSHAVRTLFAVAPWGALKLAVVGVGSGVEVYLMGVVSMGMVVSVQEERVGWDAMREGWGLMEGRRVCGWVLSGMFVLMTGVIGWEMEEGQGVMTREGGGGDSGWGWESTGAMMEVAMEYEQVGLMFLFGWVVLWGYVLVTVFYCECKKRRSLLHQIVTPV